MRVIRLLSELKVALNSLDSLIMIFFNHVCMRGDRTLLDEWQCLDKLLDLIGRAFIDRKGQLKHTM